MTLLIAFLLMHLIGGIHWFAYIGVFALWIIHLARLTARR